ncbi:MAG: hypothetical protein L6N96_03605 [Candidatus Methylarchaceae archaeon HK02M2]|nr:hypothetical protein [Candidatus Methylarchaceae archaeon HK02M2]
MLTTKACSPACAFFRCGRRALQIKKSKPWCSFANDYCDVKRCAYIQCIRGKLISGNMCGLTVKRLTVDRLRPEDFDIDIELKGKLAKRLGRDKDIV